jgi:hypothetical protein
MARIIKLESLDGKAQWRARVSVANPFHLPYVKLQRRNFFKLWETYNSMMAVPSEQEKEVNVEGLIEWAVESLVARAKRGMKFTDDLNNFVYGGGEK